MSPDLEPTAGSQSAKRSPAHQPTRPRSTKPQPAETVHRDDLVHRVRAAFAGRDIREVRMFGGVSFMLDGRMTVAAGSEGDLLVRIDPTRYEELLQLPGARDAVMGLDRPMGPGWIRVERQHLGISEQLTFWTRTALEFHAAHPEGSS